MSTGIICKIKLDPYFQQFLRGYYRIESLIFKFPREDYDELHIARIFNDLLDSPPKDFKPESFGKNEFLIEVPFQDHKDPFYCNYLSQTANEKFAKKVFEAFRDDFYDFIKEKRAIGWKEYKDIIELYMDNRQIDTKYFDRLTKDYQRWRIIKNKRKYQQKLNRLGRANCPA